MCAYVPALAHAVLQVDTLCAMDERPHPEGSEGSVSSEEGEAAAEVRRVTLPKA